MMYTGNTPTPGGKILWEIIQNKISEFPTLPLIQWAALQPTTTKAKIIEAVFPCFSKSGEKLPLKYKTIATTTKITTTKDIWPFPNRSLTAARHKKKKIAKPTAIPSHQSTPHRPIATHAPARVRANNIIDPNLGLY